jgi:hypothetical protein
MRRLRQGDGRVEGLPRLLPRAHLHDVGLHHGQAKVGASADPPAPAWESTLSARRVRSCWYTSRATVYWPSIRSTANAVSKLL